MKLLFLIIFYMTLAAHGDDINIMVTPDVLHDYKIFTKGKNPLALDNFAGEHSRRDVIELIFLQQALKIGGFIHNISFIESSSSYKRILVEVGEGRVLMSANTNWLADVNSELCYTSEVVIADGEFEAGFYTAQSNTNAMRTRTLQDLRKLIGISNKAWTADWQALSLLNLKDLENVPKWETMVKMVNKKRVDFLLAPFQQTKDMSLTYDGIVLVPIPNIKISLSGTRVFVVSKKHPLGAQAIQALNKGLIRMKKKGLIRKAYEQSGFLNSKVKKWKKINE